MKYVTTDYVPEDVNYLTPGKYYKILKPYYSDVGGYILDDKCYTISVHFSKSAHLGDNHFTVIEGETLKEIANKILLKDGIDNLDKALMNDDLLEGFIELSRDIPELEGYIYGLSF